VHGVSGGLSPLAFNNKSNLVVAAASVAYVQKPGGGEQIAFYSKGHKSAITCLAVDVTGEYAATGQAGPEAKVCVWDSSTAMHLAELICPHEEHAVAAIAWCSDSERIASVGTDPLHTLCVWRWRGGEGALLHSTPTETLGVLCLGWSPAGGSGAWIVQGGEQHVLFWKVEQGSGGDDEMAIAASRAASKLVMPHLGTLNHSRTDSKCHRESAHASMCTRIQTVSHEIMPESPAM
jgi:WD40 repeat protein